MKKKTTGKLSPQQNKALSRISAVMVVVALVFLVFSPGGIYALYKKKAHLAKLQEKDLELQQENVRLEQEIDRYKNDPDYVRKVAREKHGFLQKNERVYDFSKE